MDGSKDNNKTARAAVLDKLIFKKALPMKSSFFNAEARAINLVLNIISKSEHKKFIIFSDSLCLTIIKKLKKLGILLLNGWVD